MAKRFSGSKLGQCQRLFCGEIRLLLQLIQRAGRRACARTATPREPQAYSLSFSSVCRASSCPRSDTSFSSNCFMLAALAAASS